MAYRVCVDIVTYQKIEPFRMNYSQQAQALDALTQAMENCGIQYNVTENNNQIALTNHQGNIIAQINPTITNSHQHSSV